MSARPAQAFGEFEFLSAVDRAALAGLKPLLLAEVCPALDRIYASLRSVRERRGLLGTDARALDAHASEAKGRQSQHFSSLCDGEVGEAHRRRVRALARHYVEIGLEPRWYIAATAAVAESMSAAILRRGRFRSRRAMRNELNAFVKVLLLDAEMFASACRDVDDDGLIERLGCALEGLAQGNFARRAVGLPLRFASVQGRFNAAMERLSVVAHRLAWSLAETASTTRQTDDAWNGLDRRERLSLGPVAEGVDHGMEADCDGIFERQRNARLERI